jgi:hypothetical protein
VKTPILSIVLMVGAASAAVAQQVVDAPVSDGARQQMRVFERNLMTAIEGAGRQIADRVRQVAPNGQFQLQFQTDPIVTGVILPEMGPTFYVQIPAIEGVSLALYNNYRNQSPNRPINPVNGVVSAEPMPLIENPDKEYTTLMRTSLIDAILDNALSLPITESQTLTLIAGDLTRDPASNPLAQASRKLILQIKGADLLALRKNLLSREDAKAKIMESRY